MSLAICSNRKLQLFHKISQTHLELLQVMMEYKRVENLIGVAFQNYRNFIKQPSARDILFSALEFRSELLFEWIKKDEALSIQQESYLAMGGLKKSIDQIFRINEMYFTLPKLSSSRTGA